VELESAQACFSSDNGHHLAFLIPGPYLLFFYGYNAGETQYLYLPRIFKIQLPGFFSHHFHEITLSNDGIALAIISEYNIIHVVTISLDHPTQPAEPDPAVEGDVEEPDETKRVPPTSTQGFKFKSKTPYFVQVNKKWTQIQCPTNVAHASVKAKAIWSDSELIVTFSSLQVNKLDDPETISNSIFNFVFLRVLRDTAGTTFHSTWSVDLTIPSTNLYEIDGFCKMQASQTHAMLGNFDLEVVFHPSRRFIAVLQRESLNVRQYEKGIRHQILFLIHLTNTIPSVFYISVDLALRNSSYTRRKSVVDMSSKLSSALPLTYDTVYGVSDINLDYMAQVLAIHWVNHLSIPLLALMTRRGNLYYITPAGRISQAQQIPLLYSIPGALDEPNILNNRRNSLKPSLLEKNPLSTVLQSLTLSTLPHDKKSKGKCFLASYSTLRSQAKDIFTKETEENITWLLASNGDVCSVFPIPTFLYATTDSLGLLSSLQFETPACFGHLSPELSKLSYFLAASKSVREWLDVHHYQTRSTKSLRSDYSSDNGNESPFQHIDLDSAFFFNQLELDSEFLWDIDLLSTRIIEAMTHTHPSILLKEANRDISARRLSFVTSPSAKEMGLSIGVLFHFLDQASIATWNDRGKQSVAVLGLVLIRKILETANSSSDYCALHLILHLEKHFVEVMRHTTCTFWRTAWAHLEAHLLRIIPHGIDNQGILIAKGHGKLSLLENVTIIAHPLTEPESGPDSNFVISVLNGQLENNDEFVQVR
jgi:hypothetical protein